MLLDAGNFDAGPCEDCFLIASFLSLNSVAAHPITGHLPTLVGWVKRTRQTDWRAGPQKGRGWLPWSSKDRVACTASFCFSDISGENVALVEQKTGGRIRYMYIYNIVNKGSHRGIFKNRQK